MTRKKYIMGKSIFFLACLDESFRHALFMLRTACTHQFHSFRPRINVQWLSELRQLWASILWQVVCKLVSLMDSHLMHGQDCQPIFTSLSQGHTPVSCNLPPTLSAEWKSLLHVAAVTQAGNRYQWVWVFPWLCLEQSCNLKEFVLKLFHWMYFHLWHPA